MFDIYVDGSVKKSNVMDSRGSGISSFVIFYNGTLVDESRSKHDRATNNEMEVQAVIDSLEYLWQYVEHASMIPDKIRILSDSNNVIGWITGNYSLKAENIKPMIAIIKGELDSLKLVLGIEPEFVKIDSDKNKAHVE